MCGKYKQLSNGDQVADAFRARRRTPAKDPYGIALPGMDLPVIRENAQGRFMDALNWGFTPHWATEDKTNRFINARSETAATKAAFRDAWRLRRCIIPADGFAEWDAATKPKTPCDITPQTPAPFAFAGLWDRWVNPQTGTWQDRFAILTMAASSALAAIHDRMPVILTDAADIDRWLARDTAAPALDDIIAKAAQHSFDIRRETPEEVLRQGSLF